MLRSAPGAAVKTVNSVSGVACGLTLGMALGSLSFAVGEFG